jgi:NADH-quinone oxidoreductase subunit H
MDSFIVISLIKILVVFGVLMTTLAYLQWVERKVIAHIQVRPGPYRVGPHGLLQPLADVIKLITKEDLVPPYVNKTFYLAAPFLAITMALLSISVIPFGPEIRVALPWCASTGWRVCNEGYQTLMQLTDLNIGVLFVLAASSMGVYGIALAGWSSNNKYALIGGLRSSAQMISYELPLSLAIAAPLLISNTLSLGRLVERQSGSILSWNLFHGPFPQVISFIIFLIAAFAETNRVPFDLPEAENELVAGFHTEYSSMKFASFFMAEYANMITVSSMATLLFLGGWVPPWPAAYGSSYVPALIFAFAGVVALYHGINAVRSRDKKTLPAFGIIFLIIAAIFLLPMVQSWLSPLFWFSAKTGSILFAFMWVRGTLPRFRYDQLMAFAWKFLFPVAILNLLVTGFLVAWFS